MRMVFEDGKPVSNGILFLTNYLAVKSHWMHISVFSLIHLHCTFSKFVSPTGLWAPWMKRCFLLFFLPLVPNIYYVFNICWMVDQLKLIPKRNPRLFTTSAWHFRVGCPSQGYSLSMLSSCSPHLKRRGQGWDALAALGRLSIYY